MTTEISKDRPLQLPSRLVVADCGLTGKVQLDGRSRPGLPDSRGRQIGLRLESGFLSTLHTRDPARRETKMLAIVRTIDIKDLLSRIGTHFHTIILSAGTYLALPMLTLQLTPLVFSGVGI